MPDEPTGSRDERIEYHDEVELEVRDFPAEGPILDVGGGGEGVIGLLKGDRVVAIDASACELEEAPAGPLKIVMDARELKFLDASFDTATAFFSLMYIDGEAHGRVLGELFRVLRPGGRLLVWDVVFQERTDARKEAAVFRFRFRLPDRAVATGYGVKRPAGSRGIDWFTSLAGDAGFRVERRAEVGPTFFLELAKPVSVG